MLTLINKKNNQSIAKNIREAKSLIDLTLGMLLPKNKQGLLIKTNFGIHTFGMQFPIEVIVLDHQNKVVKIGRNLKPNRFFFWNPKYGTIIELPIIQRKGDLKIGDVLLLFQKTSVLKAVNKSSSGFPPTRE